MLSKNRTTQRGLFPKNCLPLSRITTTTAALFSAFSAAFFAVSLVGCSSEPFPLEKVSGKVVYEDGTPVKADSIQVIFKPQNVAAVGDKSSSRL